MNHNKLLALNLLFIACVYSLTHFTYYYYFCFILLFSFILTKEYFFYSSFLLYVIILWVSCRHLKIYIKILFLGTNNGIRIYIFTCFCIKLLPLLQPFYCYIVTINSPKNNKKSFLNVLSLLQICRYSCQKLR